MDVLTIYRRRFGQGIRFRDKLWGILCKDFFQKYIPEDAVVIDVAAGYCEFINNIRAKRKIALDYNPDTKKYSAADVQFILSRSTDMRHIDNESCDIAFVSNFFEHISKSEIIDTVKEVCRILKNNGKLLILQPNIRFCYKEYWSFFDHITPLDDRSLSEALETNGFKIIEVRPKFLPYTTKSRFPKHSLLIKLYLKIRFLQYLFGKQAFVVAQKNKAPLYPAIEENSK